MREQRIDKCNCKSDFPWRYICWHEATGRRKSTKERRSWGTRLHATVKAARARNKRT